MTDQGETGEAITILLVEDDAPTCWRLQDARVKAGYEARTAGTLGEARSALAAGAPRVLLTDLVSWGGQSDSVPITSVWWARRFCAFAHPTIVDAQRSR